FIQLITYKVDAVLLYKSSDQQPSIETGRQQRSNQIPEEKMKYR
ncbi:unnamed protein product, partial [Rotaria sp. Silwood2]